MIFFIWRICGLLLTKIYGLLQTYIVLLVVKCMAFFEEIFVSLLWLKCMAFFEDTFVGSDIYLWVSWGTFLYEL